MLLNEEMQWIQRSLHKAWLIGYHRGTFTIFDRKGLVAASCKCYEVVANELGRLLG